MYLSWLINLLQSNKRISKHLLFLSRMCDEVLSEDVLSPPIKIKIKIKSNSQIWSRNGETRQITEKHDPSRSILYPIACRCCHLDKKSELCNDSVHLMIDAMLRHMIGFNGRPDGPSKGCTWFFMGTLEGVWDVDSLTFLVRGEIGRI